MQSRIQSIVPQFTVPKVLRTAEYYRDVWGFRIVGYGRVPGGYDLYLRVIGLDSMAALLSKQGADVLEGPELREYGMRELVVRDCNGLIIAMGEAVPAPGT